MKRKFPANRATLSLSRKGICSLVTQFYHIAQHTVPYILLGLASHDNGFVCSKLPFLIRCNREREREREKRERDRECVCVRACVCVLLCGPVTYFLLLFVNKFFFNFGTEEILFVPVSSKQSLLYVFSKPLPCRPQNPIRDAICTAFFQVINLRHF